MIAFAYTPVPYTVNPFLSAFSKHPDYLIHPCQPSSKGRFRGSLGATASLPSRRSTGELPAETLWPQSLDFRRGPGLGSED